MKTTHNPNLSSKLDSVTKAAVLVEALPYIQRFKDTCFVVKYGGSFMEHPDPVIRGRVAYDLALLAAVGIRTIVVHGGGKAINRGLQGVEPTFIEGLRVTDKTTMNTVERILNTEVNPQICKMIKSGGGEPKGIPGNKLFRCRKLEFKASNGRPCDLGYVGEITHVDTTMLKEVLASGIIPVISPIALDKNGVPFNTNADTAATAVAMALQAHRLVYLCDVPGLLRDPNDPASLISTLRLSSVEAFKKSGIIRHGMRPKVDAAVQAINGGVHRVHFIDGQTPHSLLLEIFTDKGIGTEIVPSQSVFDEPAIASWYRHQNNKKRRRVAGIPIPLKLIDDAGRGTPSFHVQLLKCLYTENGL